MSDTVLKIDGLCKHFPIRKGFLGRQTGAVKAVDGVDFHVGRGEIFGLVGESGCGKSTIGRAILRAFDITSGRIVYSPQPHVEIELGTMNEAELRPLRRELQMIFQDPYSSLNPRMTVSEIIGEPLRLNRLMDSAQIPEEVRRLLRDVGLNPSHMNRYPHAFSGGQRQRIGIARALVMKPRFVVADEAVSALDVSVQAQILELLLELKAQYSLSYLFISHDLSVIKYLCTRVGVMYVGKLVEVASRDDLFSRPLHPYTQALISVVPIPNPRMRTRFRLLEGEVANPAAPPSGCYFHPRCPFAKEICRDTEPALRNVVAQGDDEHMVACHFAGEVGV